MECQPSSLILSLGTYSLYTLRMKKFEYKILVGSSSKDQAHFESELNKLGNEGWELVSAFDYSQAGFKQWMINASISSGYIFLFKREITE